VLNDNREAELRQALHEFERAIRADPRLANLAGYLCSACGSTDVKAERDRGVRKCQNCGSEWKP
jgi:ribosomal protein L37AE/L43A